MESSFFIVLFLLTTTTGIFTKIIDGYIVNPADSYGYKLMYQAQEWENARDSCVEEGAKLAVPKSKEQFAFIQKIVRSMHYPSISGSEYKLLVWVGINNIEDHKTWVNVDGEEIENTGFHTWSGENGKTFSDDPREPHCAGIDAINPGLRDWWCHRRQPYICEKTFNDV